MFSSTLTLNEKISRENNKLHDKEINKLPFPTADPATSRFSGNNFFKAARLFNIGLIKILSLL